MKTSLMQNISIRLYGILLALIVLSSCERDEPETQVPTIPGFPVNTTIAKLLEKEEGVLEGDPVVWGFVSASGEKQGLPGLAIIQGDGAAIAIKVEEAQLSKFEAGTLLFVKGKELTIKREGSFLMLARADGRALDANDVAAHIGFGAKNQKIPVLEMSVELLGEAQHQQLVTLRDVEVTNEDLDGNFGPSGNDSQKEILLQDCAGNEITVVTPKNSAIASVAIPEGRGNIMGVFTINNSRKELRLLDAKAADGLTQIRCAGSGDITLSRAIAGIIAAGEGSTIPAGTELKVVNISTTVGELNGGITVQDASGGVHISGVTTANYPLEAALIIDVGNKQLTTINGRLAISGVTDADIQIAGTYQYPEKITSIANMTGENMSNTLVKINDVGIMLYDNFATEKVYRLRDNSGRVHLTLANASGITLTANTASVTGYFAQENGENKFFIRQQADVVYGGTAPDPDPNYIIENFAASYAIRKDNGNMIANGKALYYYAPQDAVYDNYLTAPTGKWLFYGALFWKTRTGDIVNPTAVMIGASAVNTTPPTAGFPDNGPGYIETQFAFDGMKRIRVRFGSNASTASTYRIEVLLSTNEGVTWSSLGITTTPRTVLGMADFSPNIPRTEKVRLRLVNQTPEANGRWGALMNVVDITVEQPD